MAKRSFCGAIPALILAALIAGCGSSPEEFTLTVNIVGGGDVVRTVGGVVNDGPYADGTKVHLTAVPAAPQIFGYWGDDRGYANPLEVTMDEDLTITAHFGLACVTCGGERTVDCEGCVDERRNAPRATAASYNCLAKIAYGAIRNAPSAGEQAL